MQKLLSILALCLSVTLIFSACGSENCKKNNNHPSETTPIVNSDFKAPEEIITDDHLSETTPIVNSDFKIPEGIITDDHPSENTPIVNSDFKIPEGIITEEEYRARVDALLSGGNFETVNKSYTDNLDKLREDLYNLIIYNEDTPEFTGTAYYVSNSGNDNNNGLTPETAWATLSKASHTVLKPGDAVLFERGGLWRGNLLLQNGITYAAYGKGYKPKIYNSLDVKSYEWEKSEYPNVWVTKKSLGLDDVGNLVFDNERCGKPVSTFTSLKSNYNYLYAGPKQTKVPSTKKLYIYCSEGNPAEIYNELEASKGGSVATFQSTIKENITLHSLELSYGQDYFYSGNIKNMKVSYCSFRFSGGQLTPSADIRFGGGGGAGGNCDGLYFDHCFIYQQFDAGVTTQANGSAASVFKDFSTTDCLIEKTEYPYEYFQHIKGEENIINSRYENIHFAYNLCYDTGGGFGDKRSRSSCIVGNSDKQNAINCMIEKNIFDRSQKLSVNISAYDLDGNYSTDNLFNLRNNLYVITSSDAFARINGRSFTADKTGVDDYISQGFEENPIVRIVY